MAAVYQAAVTFTASAVILFAAPANAENIVQLWSCKLNDGKTSADLVAVSSAWLKAAKSMEGGEDAKAYLEFPMVANAGDGDFTFVLVVPDTAAWGEVASCSSSSLWESAEIE